MTLNGTEPALDTTAGPSIYEGGGNIGGLGPLWFGVPGSITSTVGIWYGPPPPPFMKPPPLGIHAAAAPRP